MRQTDFQISRFLFLVSPKHRKFCKGGDCTAATSIGIWPTELDSLKQHVCRRHVDHVASMFASKFILPFFIFVSFHSEAFLMYSIKNSSAYMTGELERKPGRKNEMEKAG